MHGSLRLILLTLGLGGFAVSAGGANCTPQSDFQCVSDENCTAEGEGGICESNSFCSFPDDTCESGRRWHDRASSTLASVCLDDGSAGTESDPSTSTTDDDDSEGESTSSDSAPPSDSSSTSDDPTADPTTDPTTDPSGGSSTGSDATSTGSAASCQEIYGAAADFELCMETADACAFNVTTNGQDSCDDVCQGFGGTCLSAQLNQMPRCEGTGEATCDDASNLDLICSCSRQ